MTGELGGFDFNGTRKRVTALEKELAAAQARIEELEGAATVRVEVSPELQAEIDGMRAEIERVRDEDDQLRARIRELNGAEERADQAYIAAADLRAQVQTLTREVADARRERDEARKGGGKRR